MTAQDRERPTHATGAEYKEVLSGLVEQDRSRGRDPLDGKPTKEHEESRKKAAEKKSNPLHVLLLVVVLAGLVGWNVYYLNRPIEPAPVENQRRAAALKLYHAAQAVEAYRTQRGELPEELAGLNVPRGDFEYTRADTGYTLVLRAGSATAQYRSGTDLRELVTRAGVRGGDRSESDGANEEGGEGTDGTGGSEGTDGS